MPIKCAFCSKSLPDSAATCTGCGGAVSLRKKLKAKLKVKLVRALGYKPPPPPPPTPPITPEEVIWSALSTRKALARIAARGVSVTSVIDVGASDGRWSEIAMSIFPDARYLLVEAQDGHLPALKDFAAAHPNADFVIAAAGDKVGDVFFDDANLFGGIAHKTGGPVVKKVPMVTLDSEVASRQLPGPYLLKLDTHGFEVPILNGAGAVLKSAAVVVIETYNFHITPESLLFHEMCEFMGKLGFRVIDVSEPLWRQHDQAFWQMDLFFVPSDDPALAHVTYG